MFKKLLSNLAFNPSLIGQVSFYAKRMHSEAGIRRTGLIILSLALALQVFAVASPVQPTLASSSNDMINGGVSSRQQTLDICNANTRDFKTILAYYGIACKDLANAPVVTIKSTDYNGKLYSMGHLAYGKQGETAVSIPGVSHDMYLRYLKSWDNGAASTYKAFKGTTANGTTFFILFSCGNLTFVGMPKPAPKPTPSPDPTPTPTPCKYDSSLTATDSKCPQPCKYNDTLAANNPQCPKPCPTDASLAVTDTKCTQPSKCPYNSSLLANDANCPRPCAYDSSIAATNSKCPAPCPTNSAISSKDTKCTQPEKCKFNAKLLAADSACPKACTYGTSVASTDSKCPAPCAFDASVAATNPKCPSPCPADATISSKDAKCKSCAQSQNNDDVKACLTFSKTVTNSTQNKQDANGTTANPGDLLVYTLVTTNTGKAAVKDYHINENVSDVLDYADITNLNGSTKNSDNIITWPATTIDPGEKVIRSFMVKVKDQLPATPASASDPGHYDMTMTNVYGNTVNIKLPPPTIGKTIEVATVKSLPNTGPGASVAIAFLFTVFAGYFFARSRLIAKELDIVRADFGGAGRV